MTTQRAIVKGTILGLVQIRNMFTCNVVPSGGDTAVVLWTAYLDSIYTEVVDMLHSSVSTYSVEYQNRSGSQWVTFDEETFTYTGAGASDALPNVVSAVLIGKASGVRHMGRKFFGPIAEAAVVANSLIAGYMVIAAAVLLAYLTPFTGLGGGVITPGVLDKTETFRPFVGGMVSSLLGSMRRRKPGNGV